MKNIHYILLLFILGTLVSCNKNTSTALTNDSKAVMNKATDKMDKPLETYMEMGLISCEVVDSTGELAEMVDMFPMMFGEAADSKIMIKDGKMMDYETDVTGAPIKFAFTDLETGVRTKYAEVDFEKVYSVFGIKNVGDDEPIEGIVTVSETMSSHSGFDCKSITLELENEKGGPSMKMVNYYTHEIPVEDYSSIEPSITESGFTVLVEMYMGGVKMAIGVKDRQDVLPNPEFFNLDLSEYKEIPNDDFPKDKPMF